MPAGWEALGGSRTLPEMELDSICDLTSAYPSANVVKPWAL